MIHNSDLWGLAVDVETSGHNNKHMQGIWTIPGYFIERIDQKIGEFLRSTETINVRKLT